jgi:cystathionine beta-synthase
MYSPTSKTMFKFEKKGVFDEVTVSTKLASLDAFFNKNSVAIVTERSESGEMIVRHVVTKVDLLHFLVKKL